MSDSNSESATNTNTDPNVPNEKRPKKRGRPAGSKASFNWSLEKSIQLLRKRKEMDALFIGAYNKSDIWIMLINDLGWKVNWNVVRDKFQNLKKQYNKKPPTGVEGNYHVSMAKQELYELISYFCDDSDKYHPLKVIDSAQEPEPVTLDASDIPETDDLNILDGNSATQTNDNDEFFFSNLDRNGDNLNSDEHENLENSGSQYSSSSFTSLYSSQQSRSSISSDIDHSKSRKKVRRSIPTYRDIFLGNAEVLSKIAKDFERFTNAACPLYESWTNSVRNSNRDVLQQERPSPDQDQM